MILVTSKEENPTLIAFLGNFRLGCLQAKLTESITAADLASLDKLYHFYLTNKLELALEPLGTDLKCSIEEYKLMYSSDVALQISKFIPELKHILFSRDRTFSEWFVVRHSEEQLSHCKIALQQLIHGAGKPSSLNDIPSMALCVPAIQAILPQEFKHTGAVSCRVKTEVTSASAESVTVRINYSGISADALCTWAKANNIQGVTTPLTTAGASWLWRGYANIVDTAALTRVNQYVQLDLKMRMNKSKKNGALSYSISATYIASSFDRACFMPDIEKTILMHLKSRFIRFIP